MKYTRFQDIPPFIEDGNYEVDFDPRGLVRFIRERVEEDGLQLEPDFQRGRVWTEDQQIAYVEFFLRGGKTGRVIYLNQPSWMGGGRLRLVNGYDDFVVVDGLQRITAFTRFIDNEIPVYGSYYREFTDRAFLKGLTVRVNVNTLKTKAEVLRWYLQTNTGGTPHTASEIERVKSLLAKEEGKS